MNVVLSSSDQADLLAVFVREGAALPDFGLDGLVERAAKQEEFKGVEGSVLSLHAAQRRVAAIGIGKERDADRTLEQLRAAASRVVKLAKAAGVRTAAISAPIESESEIEAIAEGAVLGAYVFDRYKKEKKPLKLEKTLIVADKRFAKAARLGVEIASAVNLARDLVNEPAGRITPRALAEEARKMARESGLRCDVLSRAQIKKLGMNLFLAVAQGSAQEPQLVRISYERPGKAVALVGKAITFDSGGLSIKSAQGMEDMKADMAGAAAVIAAMKVIAHLKPPFPVRAYFGACENLPSGTAYKPGDVITGKNGTSVEVLNTDAEGRLVLADVLSWAVEEKPAAIVDLATLTAAILTALGPWMSGLFSNDDALAAEVSGAARAAGEPIWRMPLPPEMEELIKSPIADLKNTGGRYGGAINAALFLQHFVNHAPAGASARRRAQPGSSKTPWAHLDIAGPAFIDKERGYNPRGGTGAGVRLLVEWIRRRSGQE